MYYLVIHWKGKNKRAKWTFLITAFVSGRAIKLWFRNCKHVAKGCSVQEIYTCHFDLYVIQIFCQYRDLITKYYLMKYQLTSVQYEAEFIDYGEYLLYSLASIDFQNCIKICMASVVILFFKNHFIIPNTIFL